MILVCVCVVIPYFFWTSGCLWTYQPGSHRRKVAQDLGPILREIENADRKRKTALFFDPDFSIRRKMDFDDFRAAAFFDLAFSIATSYRKMGVLFIREDGDRKILRVKIPRRVHGPLTKTKRKHQSIKAQTTRHTRAFEDMIVDSGVDNTASDLLHSSATVATTDGCCCFTILLPPARRAAV